MLNRIINEEEGDNSAYINLLNRYLFFLFCIFIFFSLFTKAFLKDTLMSLFLVSVSLVFLLIRGIKKTKYSRKFLTVIVSFIIIQLTFYVSFFHVYNYKNAGDEYFYFTLLLSIPFFFDYKTQIKTVYFLAFIIALNFVTVEYFDLDFIPRRKLLTHEDLKVLKLANIILSIVVFFINISFIAKKSRLIGILVRNVNSKNAYIGDLEKSNNELSRQVTLIQDLAQNKVEEIIELAEKKSPLFLEKFQLFFPDFIPALLSINPDLISSELYMCVLIKLEFSTKKIAICTDSTVKSVESKKYRIKKKLNISGSINYFLSKV
ncbi:Two component regulator three Y domain-containing protein [Elizabethkingia meningoseptica]|nr:Two component regulator three Y domain-containing protein [Elizabethkingia meningoseptica]MDE5468063.1 Two component regulator three Y domain-containing protein [Elizabethkingia meningoseptica]MDE5474982.1 Two component regulator three Y domain-containing protein [Elizabethkingia meningoseptica]MDE5478415.1 Two component regulator three Y domain-containing protein [Elizabethkingia meningoseptica]MDE5486814.1 Two component regulator three Y domain-containing protein [Elizabethkingia meningose